MVIKDHAKAGFGTGLLYSFLQGIVGGVFFFLASVLLDFDHIIDFLWRSRGFWKSKKISIKDIKYILKKNVEFDYACCSPERLKRRDVLIVLPFHTVEFLLIVLTAALLIQSAFPSAVLMAIFWGALFHLILDVVYNIRLKTVPAVRTFSLFEYLIRKRLMKEKRGINIEESFDEILDSILNEAKPTK